MANPPKIKQKFNNIQDLINEAFHSVARAFKAIIYGFDGTNYQALHVDTSGNAFVVSQEVAATSANVMTSASVASAAAGTQLFAANANRKWFSVVNNSTQTVFVRLGSGNVDLGGGVPLSPKGGVIDGEWRGIVAARVSGGTSKVGVAELV